MRRGPAERAVPPSWRPGPWCGERCADFGAGWRHERCRSEWHDGYAGGRRGRLWTVTCRLAMSRYVSLCLGISRLISAKTPKKVRCRISLCPPRAGAGVRGARARERAGYRRYGARAGPSLTQGTAGAAAACNADALRLAHEWTKRFVSYRSQTRPSRRNAPFDDDGGEIFPCGAGFQARLRNAARGLSGRGRLRTARRTVHRGPARGGSFAPRAQAAG